MRRTSPQIAALLMLGLVCLSLTATALAETLIEHPDANQTLQQRWQWAQQRQGTTGEALVAWQFNTDVDEKLHVNALSAFEHGIGWNRGLSLDALLAGNRRAQDAFMRPRELLVVAHISKGELRDVDVLDRKDTGFWRHTLYWLGAADASESYQLAASLLDAQGQAAANRGLIQAIALHAVNERTAFLNSLFTTAQWAEYRPLLVSALAQQASIESESLLLEIAHDETGDLHERRLATSALRAFGSASTLQLLLELTSDEQPSELRREAIESLAWFEPEQVTESLNQIAWFDADHRVRDEAVQSLARLRSEDADVLLLAIAREHPSAATREEALTRLQRKLF